MALFSRKRTGPAVEVDDLLRDPTAHAVRRAAAAGDRRLVGDAVAAATGELRPLVVQAAGEGTSYETAVEWTDAEPRRPEAWLVRAAAEAHLAAEARGGGPAETLRGDQIFDFEQLMAAAARSARRAAELGPADPEPWALLVKSEYSAGGERLAEHIGQLRRRDPSHVWGLRTAVDLLGEKWYGEPGEARAFAEELAREAPVGSNLPVVVADAVREQWLHLAVFEKKRVQAVRFVSAPESREAVLAALATSVEAPGYRPTPLTPMVRNAFAFTLHLCGEDAAAARQLAGLDGLATRMPWALLGDVEKAYDKVRRAAR